MEKDSSSDSGDDLTAAINELAALFNTDYRPSFDDLLTHLRAGTLSELIDGGDNPQTIFIDSRPRGEAKIWVGPDGLPVRWN